MSNDENKSLQQNLPLSWEEESQNNLEEEVTPKKLLLKREEPEAETFQDEFESEPLAKPHAPKPLLLKKAADDTPEHEEDEGEYRRTQDNLDTIYDKEIPDSSDDYEEDYNEEDWEDIEDDEIEEESNELANETDSFGVTENFEDENDEVQDSIQELNAEKDEIEETSEEVLDSVQELNVEQDTIEEDEYASAFEDSGTFTLDESSEDEQSSKTPLFEEDDINSNRIEIPENNFSPSNSRDSDKDEQSPDESIFALKADTFYEVQTEDKSETEPAEATEPSEIIQDHEIQTLGSLLQEARLSCSFTIKDAAEATRIKSSYIIALESNDMEELPAKVYVLNYIRQLCREYNVPNEPIISAFEKQSESNSNGSDVKIMRVGDEDARKATKPKSKLNALLVGTSILVFLSLFLVGWYMKWFNPVANSETIKIEVNLEDIRPEVKLPAPELPIPSQ